MRTPRSEARADRFLGVRLTTPELEHLDQWRASHGNPSRSEAVRALLRGSEPAKATEGPRVPVSLRAKLEEIVDDGWAASEDGALTLALTMGLRELHKLHAEELPALHSKAREHAERTRERRRAGSEGRGFLKR